MLQDGTRAFARERLQSLVPPEGADIDGASSWSATAPRAERPGDLDRAGLPAGVPLDRSPARVPLPGTAADLEFDDMVMMLNEV